MTRGKSSRFLVRNNYEIMMFALFLLSSLGITPDSSQSGVNFFISGNFLSPATITCFERRSIGL